MIAIAGTGNLFFLWNQLIFIIFKITNHVFKYAVIQRNDENMKNIF